MLCYFCLSRIEDRLIFELKYPVDEERRGKRRAVIPDDGLKLPKKQSHW